MQWLIDKTDWILGIFTNSLRKNKHTSYPQSDESDWSASLTHDLLSPTNFWNGSLWKCGNLSQAWRFYFVFVFPHCTVQYQGAVVLMNPKCHSPVESCFGDTNSTSFLLHHHACSTDSVYGTYLASSCMCPDNPFQLCTDFNSSEAGLDHLVQNMYALLCTSISRCHKPDCGFFTPLFLSSCHSTFSQR